jgi:hypothetical protein
LRRFAFPYVTVCDIVTLDSVMGSKRSGKSIKQGKERCKILTLDDKLKILDKSRCDMNAATVGMTLR